MVFAVAGPSGDCTTGYLHRLGGAHAPSVAAVICPPFGYEEICARRSLRQLGNEIATAGIPTLRIDYHGTGDAAGSDTDPQRVQAWLASIRGAVAWVQHHTGAAAVVLIGMRVGALLAAQASASLPAVIGVLGLAPLSSGKAYMRELRAMQMAQDLPAAPAGFVATDPEGTREVMGFALTPQTQDALGKLDATTIAGQAPLVLLVDRDDLPAGEKWAAALQSQAPTELASAPVARVEYSKCAGYAEMMRDPHKAKVPRPMFDEALAWLRRVRAWLDTDGAQAWRAYRTAHATTMDSAELPTPHSTPCAIATTTYRESFVSVGGSAPLFGVLTEPVDAARTVGAVPHDGDESRTERIVLFVNAGAIYHIGPNRMYVDLARRLAARGVASLRIDIAGLGESRERVVDADDVVYTRGAISDISAVARYLQARYHRIDIVGLCSGAYHGFKAAVAGVALQHVVLINPVTFFWRTGMSLDVSYAKVMNEADRYAGSARSLEKWKKLLRGEVNVKYVAKVMGRRVLARGKSEAREVGRRVGVQIGDDVGFEIEKAIGNGAQLHFFFADQDPGYKMLREEGGSVVPAAQARGKLTIDVIERADHTFTARWAQAQLTDAIFARLMHNEGA